MSRSALALAFLAALACDPAASEQVFEVVFSNPEDGEVAYPQSLIEVGFSRAVDPETCDSRTLLLAALADDDRVAWVMDGVEVVPSDFEEHRWELVHPEMTPGLNWAVVVQSGPNGCLSAYGEPVVPFNVRFPVSERLP